MPYLRGVRGTRVLAESQDVRVPPSFFLVKGLGQVPSFCAQLHLKQNRKGVNTRPAAITDFAGQ